MAWWESAVGVAELLDSAQAESVVVVEEKDNAWVRRVAPLSLVEQVGIPTDSVPVPEWQKQKRSLLQP